MQLIYVTQRAKIAGDPHRYLAELLAGRPDGLVIREKDLSDDALYDFAAPLVPIAARYDVPLILRGSPDLARRLGIRHLQLSFAECMAAPLPEGFASVGVSVHALSEALDAQKHGASHVTYGHIFVSQCKPGLPPRGLAALEEIAGACTIPVRAIGGINAQTLPFLLPTGASAACLMSTAMTDPEPQTLTTRLRRILKRP
ncbi:MAG: thiamine phosphate synthase [Peptococcaceae bacterium]|nr:thiamine phosphate synthase [Peptococcaceae bacterium]